MTFPDIFKDLGWYFRNRDLIGRVLGNSDVLALIDAVKDLGHESAPNAVGSLHGALVSAGIDTKKLAEAIHPPGPSSSGNPDAFNAGSNNVSG